MDLLSTFDNHLQRHFGLTYLKATRDDSAHDRLRYLIHVAKKRLKNGPARVLDIGCGGGMALPYIWHAFPTLSNYIGLDLGASRLRQRYVSNTTKVEFRDVDLDDAWRVEPCDLVWSGECLEHIVDDKGVFQKMIESTRRGGVIVITVPSLAHKMAFGGQFPQWLKISDTQDGEHVRIGYDVAALEKLADGTSARLVQADAVTFADAAYLDRRYRLPKFMMPFVSMYNSARKTDDMRFKENPTADVNIYKQFQSIAGVYAVEA